MSFEALKPICMHEIVMFFSLVVIQKIWHDLQPTSLLQKQIDFFNATNATNGHVQSVIIVNWRENDDIVTLYQSKCSFVEYLLYYLKK